MNVHKGSLLIIIVVIITLLGGCQVFQSNTNLQGSKNQQSPPKTSVISPAPADNPKNPPSTESRDMHKDTSIEAPKNYEDKAKTLFEIYSLKDNLQEAVKEISLKHLEEIKSIYNKKYIEEGLTQRIDNARLVEEPGYNDYILEYKNIVKGGYLYTYYLVYELKPRYPNEFSPESAFETIQGNGWVLFDGVYLLIYHPNNTIDAPYYLANTALFDEFSAGSSTEQVLAEIVKNKIPQLELINTDYPRN